jgi:hypothetical protein
MSKWNEVLELRLNVLVWSLACVGYGVVANIAVTVNLKSERVARRSLRCENVSRVLYEKIRRTFLRPISRGY